MQRLTWKFPRIYICLHSGLLPGIILLGTDINFLSASLCCLYQSLYPHNLLSWYLSYPIRFCRNKSRRSAIFSHFSIPSLTAPLHWPLLVRADQIVSPSWFINVRYNYVIGLDRQALESIPIKTTKLTVHSLLFRGPTGRLIIRWTVACTLCTCT